jgi:hypothetical protein
MRNKLLLCGASLFLALTGCSGSGSGTGSMSIIPPVMAQTGYSNASLSGTYSMSWWNFGGQTDSNNPVYYSAIGTLQFNGNGTINGGSITLANPGNSPCVESVTGTYSLDSTALGTATLNLTSTSTAPGCSPTDTWQISLAAGGGGTGIQMMRSIGSLASGSAIKQ